jgi:hypothetical protein
MTELPQRSGSELEAAVLKELGHAQGSGLVAGEVAFLVGTPGAELEDALVALVGRGAAFRTRSGLAGLIRYHPAGARPLYDDMVVLDG